MANPMDHIKSLEKRIDLFPKSLTGESGKYIKVKSAEDGYELDTPAGGGSHASTHENGGADEVSVTGLSGELDDDQPPKAHASDHQSGGADPIKLDDLAAPDDNTDLNSSTSKHGLLPKLDNIATNFLNGQGSWAAPAGGGGATIATGTYTGDSTADRAITHGMGVTPDIVITLLYTSGVTHGMCYQFAGTAQLFYLNATTNHAISAVDGTDFHVGNAASYYTSHNYTGYLYRWIAIKV